MKSHFHFKRSILYGLVAAVVYGSIAIFSHWQYSTDIIIKAALSHGAFCFAMTCFSTLMMEFFLLFRKSLYTNIFSAV